MSFRFCAPIIPKHKSGAVRKWQFLDGLCMRADDIRPYKKRTILEIFNDLTRILTKKNAAIFVGADIIRPCSRS
jgi:hypothetical protein